MPEKSKDEVRKRIINDLESSLGSQHYGELLLIIGFILATFGSAAVLMPDANSISGEFTGSFNVIEPELESVDINMMDSNETHLVFIIDKKIRNPNIVDLRVDKIALRIDSGSETLKRDLIDGRTIIPPKESRIIYSKASINMRKLISDKISFDESLNNTKVEGTIRLVSAGEKFDKHFLESLSIPQ